jgi:hypothetical protein
MSDFFLLIRGFLLFGAIVLYYRKYLLQGTLN